MGKIPMDVCSDGFRKCVTFSEVGTRAERTLAPKQNGFKGIHCKGITVRRILCGMADGSEDECSHATFGGRKRGAQIQKPHLSCGSGFFLAPIEQRTPMQRREEVNPHEVPKARAL